MLRGSEILGEADARAARFLPPTAPPPHRRAVAACRADPPSIGQLCAHGHNQTSLMDFLTTILYRKPLPSSPAPSAPFKPRPRSLCAQVRKIAAARRPNAAKSCPRCWPNLCSRWIIFSPIPVGFDHAEKETGRCRCCFASVVAANSQWCPSCSVGAVFRMHRQL